MRSILWDILTRLEELSAATAAVMQLLAHLYSSPGSFALDASLAALVPRLWPFLRHSAAAVRLSAVQCLLQLLEAPAGGAGDTAVAAAAAWLKPLAGPLLQLLFQNLLLEGDERVLARSMAAWRALLRCSGALQLAEALDAATLGALFSLAATPAGRALDPALMVVPCGGGLMPAAASGHDAAQPVAKRIKTEPGSAGGGAAGGAPGAGKGYAAAGPPRLPEAVVGSAGEGSAVRMRMAACEALGSLCAALQQAGAGAAAEAQLQQLLGQPGATARQVAALAMWFWQGAQAVPAAEPGAQAAPAAESALPEPLVAACLHLLTGTSAAQPTPGSGGAYSELQPALHQMRSDVVQAMSQCYALGWLLHTPDNMPPQQLTPEGAAAVLATVPALPESEAAARAAVERARASVATAELLQAILHGSTAALLAAAVIRSGRLPAKLNVLLQPAMAAVRREAEQPLQRVVAQAVATVLRLCQDRKPNPADKLLKNVGIMACSDPGETPSAAAPPPAEGEAAAQQQQQQQQQQEEAELSPEAVTRRGAEMVLQAAAAEFGPGLASGCAGLWDAVAGPLGSCPAPGQPPAAEPQSLVNSLQLLKVLGPHLHPELHPALLALLPPLAACCRHANAAVRQAAAACAAGLADALPDLLLPPLLKHVAPLMEGVADDTGRAGAVQLVARLVARLGARLVAYTVLLVVPLLGRMSDPLPAVRAPASACFGQLVALLPLAQVRRAAGAAARRLLPCHAGLALNTCSAAHQPRLSSPPTHPRTHPPPRCRPTRRAWTCRRAWTRSSAQWPRATTASCRSCWSGGWRTRRRRRASGCRCGRTSRRASTGWPSCAAPACTACWRTTWGSGRRCRWGPPLGRWAAGAAGDRSTPLYLLPGLAGASTQGPLAPRREQRLPTALARPPARPAGQHHHGGGGCGGARGAAAQRAGRARAAAVPRRLPLHAGAALGPRDRQVCGAGAAEPAAHTGHARAARGAAAAAGRGAGRRPQRGGHVVRAPALGRRLGGLPALALLRAGRGAHDPERKVKDLCCGAARGGAAPAAAERHARAEQRAGAVGALRLPHAWLPGCAAAGLLLAAAAGLLCSGCWAAALLVAAGLCCCWAVAG